ncbi:DTW domain-containing protein isoform X2 [Carex rostrata]
MGSHGNDSQSPPSSSPSTRRPVCHKCTKPTKLCLCSRFTSSSPLDNSISITVLQHTHEIKHPLNSVRIAKLGFKNISVIHVSDVNLHAQLEIHPLEAGLSGSDPTQFERLDIESICGGEKEWLVIDESRENVKPGMSSCNEGENGNWVVKEMNKYGLSGSELTRLGSCTGKNEHANCKFENSSLEGERLDPTPIGFTISGTEKERLVLDKSRENPKPGKSSCNGGDNLHVQLVIHPLEDELSGSEPGRLESCAVNGEEVNCKCEKSSFEGERSDLVPIGFATSDSEKERLVIDKCRENPKPGKGFSDLCAAVVSSCNGSDNGNCIVKEMNKCGLLGSELSQLGSCTGNGEEAATSGTEKEMLLVDISREDLKPVRSSCNGGDNGNCIVKEMNKYKVICSPTSLNITVERTAKPNLNWVPKTPIGKSLINNGFRVKKLHTKKKNNSTEIYEIVEYDMIVPPNSVLLFPNEKSVGIDSVDFEVKNLIVLDGTWAKAQRMYHENPWLKLLPHLKLDLKMESLYSEVRHEPKSGCLSTIETIIFALKEFGEDSEGLDMILGVFESMILDQRRCKDVNFCDVYQS